MHKLYTWFVDDGCVFIHANKMYLLPGLVWNEKGAKTPLLHNKCKKYYKIYGENSHNTYVPHNLFLVCVIDPLLSELRFYKFKKRRISQWETFFRLSSLVIVLFLNRL